MSDSVSPPLWRLHTHTFVVFMPRSFLVASLGNYRLAIEQCSRTRSMNSLVERFVQSTSSLLNNTSYLIDTVPPTNPLTCPRFST